MLSHIMANGGLILLFILLCSVIALAVVIERCLRLLPLRRQLSLTWMDFEEQLSARDSAPTSVEVSGDNPLARVIRRAQGVQDNGRDAVRIAALEAAQREVPRLERGLGIIAIVAQVAPLLGLLGTVVGLMEAFQAAGDSERIVHSMLASGIYKALGTTAAGLGIAIPAYIAYSLLSGVASRLLDQLETVAAELPLLLLPQDDRG